jgi:hypothetical protein
MIRKPLVIVGLAALFACTQPTNKTIGDMTDAEAKTHGILTGAERDQFNERVEAGFAFALLATCSKSDALPKLELKAESGKSLDVSAPGSSTLIHIRPGRYMTLYANRKSAFSDLAPRSITFLGPCKTIPDWLTETYLYQIVRLPLIWGSAAPR